MALKRAVMVNVRSAGTKLRQNTVLLWKWCVQKSEFLKLFIFLLNESFWETLTRCNRLLTKFLPPLWAWIDNMPVSFVLWNAYVIVALRDATFRFPNCVPNIIGFWSGLLGANTISPKTCWRCRLPVLCKMFCVQSSDCSASKEH